MEMCILSIHKLCYFSLGTIQIRAILMKILCKLLNDGSSHSMRLRKYSPFFQTTEWVFIILILLRSFGESLHCSKVAYFATGGRSLTSRPVVANFKAKMNWIETKTTVQTRTTIRARFLYSAHVLSQVINWMNKNKILTTSQTNNI